MPPARRPWSGCPGSRGRGPIGIRQEDVEPAIELRGVRHAGAVGREQRRDLVAVAADEQPTRGSEPIAHVQVTARLIGDDAVPGRPEQRRQPLLCADEEGRGRDHQQADEGQDHELSHREPASGPGVREHCVQGEPPFGEGPARPLRRARGLPEDVVQVGGRAGRGDLVDRLGDPPLEWVEPVVGGHDAPPSAVIDRRSPSIARWSRDFAAGREIPSEDAASGNG